MNNGKVYTRKRCMHCVVKDDWEKAPTEPSFLLIMYFSALLQRYVYFSAYEVAQWLLWDMLIVITRLGRCCTHVCLVYVKYHYIMLHVSSHDHLYSFAAILFAPCDSIQICFIAVYTNKQRQNGDLCEMVRVLRLILAMESSQYWKY